MQRRLIFLAVAALGGLAAHAAIAGELDITIVNAKGDAPILGQVFADPMSFAVKQAGVAKFRIDPANGQAATVVKDLPPGRYAIAVFQDLNGNGKLDQSFFGVPKEPYGFSRDAEGSGLTPPGFEAAAISLGDEPQALTIHLH